MSRTPDPLRPYTHGEFSHSWDKWNEELIAAGFRKEYRRSLDEVWQEVVIVSSKLYVVRRVVGFRFDVFLSLDDQFWQLTLDAYVESCAAALWRVLWDRRKDVLTVEWLRKRLMNALAEHDARRLGERIRTVEQRHTADRIRDAIKSYRHDRVAHHLREGTRIRDQIRLYPLSELFAAARYAADCVQALSIDSCRGMYLGLYDPAAKKGIGSDPRTDVELLLDQIIENDWRVVMAREQPAMWRATRQTMPEKDLDVINAELGRLHKDRI